MRALWSCVVALVVLTSEVRSNDTPALNCPKALAAARVLSTDLEGELEGDHFFPFLSALVRAEPVSVANATAPQAEVAANYIVTAFERLNGQVEKHDMEGTNPIVLARWGRDPSKKTVLVYAHYDVKPGGKPSDWLTGKPHELVKKDDRWYGRGVVDDLWAVAATRAIVAAHDSTELPVNLVVLLEGGEEIGSPQLAEFIREHLNTLAPDAILIPDSGDSVEDKVALTISTRGAILFDLEFRALQEARAGEGAGSHSGTFSALNKPNVPLTHVLAELVNIDGTANIPGIESDIPPGQEDTTGIFASAESFAKAMGLREGARLPDSLYSPADQIGNLMSIHWSQPIIPPQMIPARASAMIEVRTSPHQNSEEVQKKIYDHIRQLAQKKSEGSGTPFELTLKFFADGWRAKRGPLTDVALQILGSQHQKPDILSRIGGSIPVMPIFASQFPNAEVLMFGANGPDSNIHAANENARAGRLEASVMSYHFFLHAVAHLEDGKK